MAGRASPNTDPTLTELGVFYGTDKAKDSHAFTRFYPIYMEVYRDRPLSFLEIGVFRGASLRMWDAYFTHPEARLCCVDNKRKHLRNVPETPRWHSFFGSQADPDFLAQVAREAGPFDIIIEDGQHVPSFQMASFGALWPHVKSGGVYVIEDIHTSFEEGFMERFAPEDDGPKSVMPYLIERVEGMVAADSPSGTEYEFVHFYTHAVILGKRSSSAP